MTPVILVFVARVDDVKMINMITIDTAALPRHQIGNLTHRQLLLTPAIIRQQQILDFGVDRNREAPIQTCLSLLRCRQGGGRAFTLMLNNFSEKVSKINFNTDHK